MVTLGGVRDPRTRESQLSVYQQRASADGVNKLAATVRQVATTLATVMATATALDNQILRKADSHRGRSRPRALIAYVTLTPFGIWFLRAMGMTIGRHAFVNTDLISDPRLIALGDDVTLGGSVRIFAHYGGGGNLVIAPVVIEDRATVGIGVTIMGDVRIGKGAVILPHSALLPGSRVGEGETWGASPRARSRARRWTGSRPRYGRRRSDQGTGWERKRLKA